MLTNTRFKTLFSIIVCLLIFGFSAYSQENSEPKTDNNSSAFSFDFINFYTPVPLYHQVTIQEKAKNYSNFELVTLGTALIQRTDMKELFVATGIESAREQFDITNDTIYAPTFWDVFNVGARLINHFSINYVDFFEYDFLIGLYTAYQPHDWVKLSFSAFYHQKNSFIYDTFKSSGAVISNCQAFNLIFDFYPMDWLTIKASLSSFDFFRYYLFFAPEYKLEFIAKVNDNLKLSFSTDAQFVDFFTLSANFSSLTATIGFTWEF